MLIPWSIASMLFVVVLSWYFITAGAQENGDLRLQEGDTPYTGRVELYMNDTWGTVEFDYGLTATEEGVAQTICTQLGYGAQTAYGTTRALSISPAADDVPTQIRNVYCPSDVNPYNASQHILRCSYEPVNYIVDHLSDMAVSCDPTPNSAYFYDTQVRLQRDSSSASSSGFLEVYLNEAWGPVCNMNGYDVDSACRQIGYTGSASSGHSDKDGYQGGLSDKLSSFHCSQSNACLRSCFNYPTADATFDCSQHTYITCTFDEDETNLSSGNSSLCSSPTDAGDSIALPVGVSIAVLFMVLVLAVVVVVCCCCVPGCTINNHRKRRGYYIVNN